MSARDETQEERDGGAARWLAPAVCFSLAFVLYGLTRRAGTFSDAVQLAERVREGPTPYYNALYLPLGWAFHAALAPLLAWDTWQALAWLSVASGALAVALCWRMLEGSGASLAARAAWCGLFALAPAVWFFAASVEVHALQLACVTGATLLAARAREAPSARAPFLVAAALLLALVGHLSTVLLAPALVLLALGRREGRGLALRALPWRALLGAAAAVALVLVLVGVAFRSFGEGRKGPLEMLGFFWTFLRARVRESGLFPAGEVASYLRRELVAPAGLLSAALVLGLAPRDRRLALATALAPYVLVLPQGGIRENGAYYLSLLPIGVLAGARALAGWRGAGAVLALALVPQAVLGWRAAVADGGGEDARVWAVEVRRLCPEGSVLYTATLPRWHAASYVVPPFEAVDVWRVLEMMPSSAWDLYAEVSVQEVRKGLAAGKRVFADVDLFEGPDRPESVRRLAAAFERAFPERKPVPAAGALVLELAQG